METKTQIERKITTKAMGYSKTDLLKACLADEENEIPLYKIAGIVSDIRAGQTDLGPFAKFIGEFRAERTDGAKVVQSGVAILPRMLEELLLGAIQQAMQGGGSLEFAAQICAKY